MLERTAAGLETCSLQRVLPKPAKRCRRLQAGFWQHGASAIDLASIRPRPPRACEAEPEASEAAPRQLQPRLLASAIVLDFLYPRAALPLLRRVYPGLPRSQDRHPRALVSPRRSFASGGSKDAPEDSKGSEEPQEELAEVQPDNSDDAASHPPRDLAGQVNTEPSFQAELPPPVVTESSAAEFTLLAELLSDSDGRRYQEVWDLFSRLDHDQRIDVRGQVVQYLANSHGIVETGRATSIFRQIPVHEWDDELLSAGILLLLRSGERSSAVEKFKKGLEIKGIHSGLEYLLADAISARQWPMVLDAWIAYYDWKLRTRPERVPSTKRLRRLDTIPDQGTLYIAFRSYLSTEGKEYYQEIKRSPVSLLAFRAFQLQFAEMALWEPCSPEQAAVILENHNDNRLYNTYFNRMFDRWYEKEEPKANILKLPEIYQKFRSLTDAKPDDSALRGMFKIYYPHDFAGLMQVHDDWLRFRGKHSRWSYEKFLKLYAYRGDISKVQSLWKEYVEAFPEALQSPRGFRSIVNVHAQAGDVEGVKREIENMRNHGIQPDVDSLNMLLKGYMRTNDYEGTMECFEEICATQTPDSFTYAHIMAMSAKKGDLETTLDIFQRSQEAQAPVTKEMVLAIIVAYCRNDLLMEAETLCVEFSERKDSSTAVWNQLLYFNGVKGNLEQCYSLLRRMKEYRLEWDEETYALLLQALVKVNQVRLAHVLLKRADEEKLFKVTPEHFAIVMAGAARTGQHVLVEALDYRLRNSGHLRTFNALVALVENAVKRKPGIGRTKALGKEFIDHFRQVLANARGEETKGGISQVSMPGNISKFRGETWNVGRAIMLLVELRDSGTTEELITIYKELFPHHQQDYQFPPNIVSALMLAHYQDGNYEKVEEMWTQTWARVLKESSKLKGSGIYPAHEYELSRVLRIVLLVYYKSKDKLGLSKCIEQVTSAGFKLTRSNWDRAISFLADLDNWERAMYWCETMLMPGWRGWNPERSHKEKRLLLNTRVLKPPKPLVLKLQQEWLKLRKMAAWSSDVSRKLRHVQERYPRLHHAFTVSDFENLPAVWKFMDNKFPVRELDKMLQRMPYRDLMKIKDALLRQLMREKNREKRLGLNVLRRRRTPAEHKRWKQQVHLKVRRYAAMWAQRRVARATALAARSSSSSPSSPSSLPSSSPSSSSGEGVGADQGEVDAGVEDATASLGASERQGFWQVFWQRYDQRPHHTGRSPPRRNQGKRQNARMGNLRSLSQDGRYNKLVGLNNGETDQDGPQEE